MNEAHIDAEGSRAGLLTQHSVSEYRFEHDDYSGQSPYCQMYYTSRLRHFIGS